MDSSRMDFGKRRHSFRGRFFLWWLMSAAISGLGCPLQGSMSERGFRGESGTDLVEAAGAPAKPWYHLPDTLDYSVLIVGMAKGAEGREVVWRADADPVSGKYMELGRGTVDSNGRFILASSEVSGVLPTYLLIDYYSTSIFVEAGKVYRLEMAGFDYHADEKTNAFIVSDQLPALTYRILDEAGHPDTTGLNYLLGRYSQLYNRMMARDFERIQTRKDTAPVVAFMHLSDSLFADVPDSFFQDYRFYVEAGLQEFSAYRSRRGLFDSCIANRDIDFGNPAQMMFLESYFMDYFTTNPFLPFDQVRRIVNRNDLSPVSRLGMLSDSLSLDYALRNEYLHDWVLVHALNEGLGNERLNDNHIRAMLQTYRARTKFPLLARTVDNLLTRRDELEKRQYFKHVCFTDTSGRKVLVDTLLQAGMFHYFVFVRADYDQCPACNEESLLLAKIWNTAGEDVKKAVKIIYINCDYRFERYLSDARAKQYPWLYLHFDRNIEWVRQIDAAHFPAFVLVDDQGHVLNPGFNAPSQNIGDVFRRMATLKALQDRRNTSR